MKKSISLFFVLFLFIIFEVFCNPFGIKIGMTLEQVSQISRTTPVNIEDDWYRITPPNTHELFETYFVQIHSTHGVYFIKAISRDIRTNVHGTELIGRFNNLVSNIERTYGNYLRRDNINSESIFNRSQDFMFALSRTGRLWIKKYNIGFLRSILIWTWFLVCRVQQKRYLVGAKRKR